MSPGAIIAADLAVVVIGGLLTSTLLTLVIVPVLYQLIAGRGERRGGRGERRADGGDRPATSLIVPDRDPRAELVGAAE